MHVHVRVQHMYWYAVYQTNHLSYIHVQYVLCIM